MKSSDYSCVPLCPDCHTLASGAYHRIGRREFERAKGLCFAQIASALRREWKVRRVLSVSLRKGRAADLFLGGITQDSAY